jgi:hypothetical protein
MMKRGLAMQGIPVGDVCRPRFSAPFGQAALAELRRLLETFGVQLVSGAGGGLR